MWISKKLSDWKHEKIQGIPNEPIYAPIVIKGKDNKYYLYCQYFLEYSRDTRKVITHKGSFEKAAFLRGQNIELFKNLVLK